MAPMHGLPYTFPSFTDSIAVIDLGFCDVGGVCEWCVWVVVVCVTDECTRS